VGSARKYTTRSLILLKFSFALSAVSHLRKCIDA
jgi:hypothetical protein